MDGLRFKFLFNKKIKYVYNSMGIKGLLVITLRPNDLFYGLSTLK
jgi:hypothetical protein